MTKKPTNQNRTAQTAAIEVSQLTVSYGPVPALLDISVTVEPGKLVGVIGPNGSGKSTLIKSILGFIKPDVGAVKIFGENVANVKGKIAYVPQRGSVDWDFPITVREVAVMGRYGKRRWWRDLKKEDYQLADAALEKVRMSEFSRRQIGQLSGGQQQMVAIGRGLMARPKIMLLDEPSLGLSPLLVKEIFSIVKRLNTEQGVTMVLVEQNAKVALDLAHFGYVMELGRIVMDGEAEKLAASKDIQEFYLGQSSEASQRGQRRWKQNKTWR